ncbi:hypothetical protein NQ317_007362 [Molorchus minor]|uniref:CAP-Gly domain-containing protein n=1 Tax=Molorchus minor TaxID=1323400 RepID=A0ABQ9JC13_9CUCU|nr:hypothetical protein NQ317_007362 [Molorchus minor]
MDHGEGKGPGLDIVRALHQTVVALRAALEESKSEILDLKSKTWPTESVQEAIRALSIENHVLRRKLLDSETNKKNNLKNGRENNIKEKSELADTNSGQTTNTRTNITSRHLHKNQSIMSDTKDTNKQVSDNDLAEEQLASEELRSPQNDLDQTEEVDDIELIFTTDDTKESDFKEQLVSIDAGDSAQEASNLLQLPLSDMDQNLDGSDRELDDDKKDESFDRFDERVRIVETDISKCGIHDNSEYTVSRRNTCPNPLQYRPLLHREALSKVLTVSRKSRPILTHSNAIRKESGAQTDISALPGSSWRSESSLASKARLGDHFTTLPSKIPLPGSRLRLGKKTVEARRVLLSDIGFTSMVPELSRSADHLFPPNLKPAGLTPSYGQFLKTTDLYSPHIPWAATTYPSDTSQPHSPPVSPSRKCVSKPLSSKVRFANGSLPELSGDWTITIDSGDSTDSLVEEAESYLRRSIDCIISGRDISSYFVQRRHNASGGCGGKKSVLRRASAPEPARDNVPPPGWHPFLPRVSRDLKPDHWVKVITPEGRVRGGRVRYVGPVVTQTEQFVGVQLSTPDGYCDGTYSNRRYFQCEPYHGIFVPFKKVIMGWRP